MAKGRLPAALSESLYIKGSAKRAHHLADTEPIVEREREAEQMGTPRQQQQLCVVFLLALLVVFTMDAVHVDAGRPLTLPPAPGSCRKLPAKVL